MWLLGVDAGGSHTRVGILHAGTGEWREGRADGANWTVHGPQVCAERLACAVADAGGLPDAPCAAHLGFAGFYPPHHEAEARDRLAHLLGRLDPVSIGSDLETACSGALAGNPGVVVIAGTGSVVCGVAADGRFERAGGWGPLVGDPGSGHELGLKALRVSAEWVDSRGRAPRFLAKVLGEAPTRQNVTEWIRSAYRDEWSREKIAELAPILLEAASSGDGDAILAVNNSAIHLALQVISVSKRLRLPPGFTLTYQGGLLTGSEYFRERLFQQAGDYRLEFVPARPQLDPLRGAVLRAARSVSLNLEGAALEHLGQQASRAAP